MNNNITFHQLESPSDPNSDANKGDSYRQAGLTDAEIEQVLGAEIQSMITSPPARPMDPTILDGLPGTP
jgi:hypothetical protein